MNNLDKRYQELLQDILDNGIKKEDRTGTGTLSVFGRQIRHKMSEGFPLLTTKKMYWKGIVTELLWFLRGDTNIKFLVDNDCHIWNGDAYKRFTYYTDEETSMERFIELMKTDDEFAEKWGELGPIYGKQWRDWGGKEVTVIDGNVVTITNDQIQDLINDLRTNPDSRRMMVNAWNVGELDSMTLPPCHYGFQVYTRELSFNERWSLYSKESYDGNIMGVLNTLDYLDEKNIPSRAISLMFNMRSNDVPLGLPFNLASYGLLLEIIAKEVNMVSDELIASLGDAHIYVNQIECIKEQLTREPYPLPKLNLNNEWWDDSFFDSVLSESFCKCLLGEDIQLSDYKYHPSIKIPLSN